MKNMSKNKLRSIRFLPVLLLVFVGCSEEINTYDWYSDAFIGNVKVSLESPNPNTGVAYTEAELAALSYDPTKRESYQEGQMVNLTVVSDNMPSEIQVVDGNLTILETITEFTPDGGQFRAKSFTKTLEELGLVEKDDKIDLTFKISYTDGPPAKLSFQAKKIVIGGEIDTFVFLKKSTGEIIPLEIDDKSSSRVDDPSYGAIVEFDGVDDQVEILNVPELAFRYENDYSIGFWMNTTSTDSDPVMVGDQNWNSSNNDGLSIAFRGDNWRVAKSDGEGNKADTNADSAFNDGDWHYLMVTFDRDGDMTMYEDGIAVAAEDMSSVGNTESGNPIRVGQDGTGSYGQFFQGKIGEVSIYDYALSAIQVAGIASPRTGVRLKTQDGATSNVMVTNSGAGVGVEENRLAYTFNGSDQYATIDNTDLGFRYDGDYSISFWVNTISTDSDPVMIGDQDWNSSNNAGLSIAFRGNNWRVAYSDGNGNKADTSHDTAFNDGEWHLLAVTFDRDGNMTLYADGTEVASEDMSSVGTANSGNPLRLAQDGPATYGQFFEGKLAGITVYDYVLGPAEINTLYGN